MSDNRAAFEHFCELFYTQKRVADAFAYLVGEPYRQHNPNVPDGAAPAIEMLTPKFDGSPEASFEIQRMLVDGDLAMVHIKASRAGVPTAAVADLYRFDGGARRALGRAAAHTRDRRARSRDVLIRVAPGTHYPKY